MQQIYDLHKYIHNEEQAETAVRFDHLKLMKIYFPNRGFWNLLSFNETTEGLCFPVQALFQTLSQILTSSPVSIKSSIKWYWYPFASKFLNDYENELCFVAQNSSNQSVYLHNTTCNPTCKFFFAEIKIPLCP